MNKVLSLIFVSLLIIVLAACGKSGIAPSENINIKNQHELQNDKSEDKDTDNSESKESEVEKTKYSNLDLFIEEYNKIAKLPILKPNRIDIQSEEYYRTEFRLNAFQNAPAYIANLSNDKMEIINSNYKGMFGSDLRIYITVDTLEEATDIFESFCKAVDHEITQADFDDFYKYHNLDDGDVRPVIGDISGYVMFKDGMYEIMLDASPDYFDQD